MSVLVVLNLLSGRRWLAVAAGLGLLLAMRWGYAVTRHDARPAAAAPAVVTPLRAVATAAPAVALTFDVSWGEAQPRAVLDVLHGAHVRATFFVTAPWARAHPDVVRAMLAEGDQVESLGNRPIALSRYPATVQREELAAAQEAVALVTGRRPEYFRPPQGDVSPALLEQARAVGYTTVLWNVDSLDALKPGVDYIVDRVVRLARRGAIVRLHADDGASQTAAALPGIISGLRRRGLRCVTLGGLVALARPAAPAPGRSPAPAS